MACQNGTIDRSHDDAELSQPSHKKAKRQVTIATFEKWQRNYDRQYQTMTWLKYERDATNRDLVATLWCSVCRQYKDRLCSMKNYSDVWIKGLSNQCTSSVLDHVSSEQHKAAMSHFRAAQARAENEPVATYAPKARCLLTLDDAEKGH